MYGMRKFTLLAFEGLNKVTNNELYRFFAVVKSVIGVCKLEIKVNKLD